MSLTRKGVLLQNTRASVTSIEPVFWLDVRPIRILVEPMPGLPAFQESRPSKEEVSTSPTGKIRLRFATKDGVVVDTSYSAAQVIPSLFKEPYYVSSTTQIIRTTPCVMPRPKDPFRKEKYAKDATIIFLSV